MFHFFEALTPKTGLSGYFCRAIDPATGGVVTMSADDNGTPIITTSGQANMCKSDEAGNFDFYVDPGTYHLDIYSTDATTFYRRVANVAMNSTKGDKGDTGDTGPQGPTGPKGDTGNAGAPGNIISGVGLWGSFSTIVAAGATAALTTGYDTIGVGAAYYTLDPDQTTHGSPMPGESLFRKKSTDGYWYRPSRSHPLTLEQFGAKGDATHNVGGSGTDDTAALRAALWAAYYMGGAEIRLGAKAYRITEKIRVPDNGGLGLSDPSGMPKTKAIRITGQGPFKDGQSNNPTGGSCLQWDAAGGTDVAVALLDTRGLGNLDLIDFTIISRETGGTLMVFDTNTTMRIQNMAFWGCKQGTAADQDAIRLGGTTHNLDNTSTAAFQGYGTVVTGCYFNLCRTCVYVAADAQDVVVQNNTVWNRCGSTLTALDGSGGAAILVDGDPTGTIGTTIGGVRVNNNLIESTSYVYGVKFLHASNFTCINNNTYDAGVTMVSAVYLGALTSQGVITRGLAPVVSGVPQPYLSGPGAALHTYLSGYGQEPSRIISASIGSAPTLPARLEYSLFPTAPLLKPDAAITGGTIMFQLQQSAAEATNPNQVNFSLSYNGAMAGNGAGAGNYTNSLTGGASWSSNGKTWSAAGNMKINSGTGGSNVTVTGLAVLFNAQDDTTLNAKIGASVGAGSSKPGIAFGASTDAYLARIASGVLGTNAALKLPTFTVATLPAAATAGAGARAFVSDATTPTFMATVAGSGAVFTPVYSDGTNWKVG